MTPGGSSPGTPGRRSPTEKSRPVTVALPQGREAYAHEASTFAWLTVVLGLVALILSRGLWLPAIASFLVVSDGLARADYVVPLAGDLERVTSAARLYRNGYARKLLLTNLPLATPDERTAHLEQVRALALAQGVAPEDIIVVPRFAWSTYGEALRIRSTLARLQGPSLLVVTSPWHTRRSRLVFDALFHDGPNIRVLPVEGTSSRSLPGYVQSWWQGRSTAGATASEYLKLLAYGLGIR